MARLETDVRLLFLCKRHPQGRDLLERPYGRFYHLPRLLAAQGHEVHVALLSYRRLQSESLCFDGVSWTSDDLWPSGPLAYLARLRHLARAVRPDWTIGASDTYFGIVAGQLARRYGGLHAIDAYDDFESYIPWAAPLHRLWRGALASAGLVTVAGPHLARLLESRGAKRAQVVPMAAEPEYRPLEQAPCRLQLGLPQGRRLVGHIGALDKVRGRDTLLAAIEKARVVRPEISLVLTGRAPRSARYPAATIHLDYVPDQDMPALLNSLDVACISLADTAFGRSSYPVKLCEAAACGIPVVASATAPVKWMLHDDSQFFSPIGDAGAMADRILSNLDRKRVDYGWVNSWQESARLFGRFLLARKQ